MTRSHRPPPRSEAVEGVTLAEVRAAARALEGVAVRTPLLEVPGLSSLAGAPVALKCENAQPIGAFKIRGAYHAVARMARTGAGEGVVTQSSGNHGQAVAFAAARFGLRAVVVMPESTPAVKVEGVRRHGGEVVFAGRHRSPEQLARAEAIAASDGLAMIPPFDHPDVVAGQGTLALEILEQCPGVAVILAPVGGGGLIAGISLVVEADDADVGLALLEFFLECQHDSYGTLTGPAWTDRRARSSSTIIWIRRSNEISGRQPSTCFAFDASPIR